MAEEVSSIGVRLTLDASGFTAPMKEASGALNAFQAQAERAASGVAQTRAGGGASKSSAASPAAQNLTGVNVSLEISPQSLAKLRGEVTKGLGAIPVTITPQFAASGKWSIQNIMGSMLSMQYGISHTRGAQLSKQAIEQALGPLPQKAHGGPVQAGRPIIVGERRPEVFVPQTHGRIESSAREYARQQEKARRFEMELATLEIASQKRHEQNMARVRGGGVRGYGYKYGSVPAGKIIGTRPEQQQIIPPDPGFLYHGTDQMRRRGYYENDIRKGGVRPASRDWHGGADAPSVSFWATEPRVARGYGSFTLRTPRSPEFAGPYPRWGEYSGDYQEMTTRRPVTRQRLQYWGEDESWHRFRRGRARRLGGLVEGGVDWRQMPNWRTVPRVEYVRVESLLPFRQQDREVHPRYAHDTGYLDNLTEKIGAEGFDPMQPVVVHYDPFHHAAMVADGNHRIAVARRLGLETIPTTVTLVQRPQSKFRGSRMPGSSSILPDETGYIPGTLPPSWIGLRQDGGPVWKRLLSQGVIKTRNMGRRAERYYQQRYRGFDEHGLMGYGGPGRDAFDRLVQAAGYEGDTNWNQFESEFDMDFGRKVGFNTSFASRANLYEKLGALMPIEPMMAVGPRLKKLFEASPDDRWQDRDVEAAFPRTMVDRMRQAEDVINMTRDTLGSIDRKKALEIIARDYQSAGRPEHVGKWENIDWGEEWLAKTNAFPIETRPWGLPHHGATGGPKDLDLPKGQYTRGFNPAELVDVHDSVTGGNYPGKSEGLDKLTARDLRDPTQFTEAGYRTIHGLLGPDRRNARGGRVKHAWRGLTAEAFRQTTNPDIRGGTFPTRADLPVPTEGNAVGIAKFLSEQTGRDISTIKVDPTDPVAFMRAFHKMRKAGAPYVGTWWPEGEPIDVDPATVIQKRSEANLVAAYGEERAGYQLRKTPAHPYGFEWATKRFPGLEAEAGRVAEIIYGKGKKRQGGGPVFELEGMAPFLKPHVQGTVERLLAQYPMVGEHLTRVQLSRGFPPYAAYESMEAHEAFPATPTSYAVPAAPEIPGTLHVSAQSAGSSSAREYYTATGAMRKDKGFHIPGTSSITGNITHEFGHALRRHIEQIAKGGGLPETGQQLAELENFLKADPSFLRQREPGFEKFYGISPYAEQARTMPSFYGGGAFEPFAEMFSGLHTPGGKTHTIPEPLLARMEKMLVSLKLGRSGGGPVQFDLQAMRGDLRSRIEDTFGRLLERYPMIGGSPYAPNASTATGHPTLGYVGMTGREPYAEYGHPDMSIVPGSQGYGGKRFKPGIINFSMEAFGAMPRRATRPISPSSRAWWQPAVDTEWSRSNEFFDRQGNLLAGSKISPWGDPIDRRAAFSPGTATAEGIAVHEFGHAVDYYLEQNYGLGSPQNWIRDANGILMPDPTTTGAKSSSLHKLLETRAADSISGYASSARLKRAFSYHPRHPNHGDPAEPFADLFAAIETPGATAKHVRPRKMVGSMQEILEELRGTRGAATGTRRAKQAPYFLGRARKQIEALASSISPRDPGFEAARDWYTIAHAQVLGDLEDFGLGSLGNVGLGAAAAASPGKRWPTNRAILRAILATGGQSFPMSAVSVNVPGFSPVSTGGEAYGYENRRKAAEIIRTRSLVDATGRPILSGPKVVPFHGNLSGLDVDAKTLDARMSQIAGLYETVGGKRVHAAYPPGWRRSVLEQAYQESYEKHAKRLGLNNFSEYQAVLWSAVGEGADLGSDWTRTKTGIAIPRHPGLVVPFHRADGGYVEKLMGSWEPWMGYQLAMEALAKRKEAKHAQGGAFARMSKGAYTEPGEEWFHFLPDADPYHGALPWRAQAARLHHPSAFQLEAIDRIRDQPIEHGLVMPPNSGNVITREVLGDEGSVTIGDILRKISVHNHPIALGSTLGNGLAPMVETVRPSNNDLLALIGGRGYEGWTVTPNFTSIMRSPGWIDHKKFGVPMAAATTSLASDVYLQEAIRTLELKGMVSASRAKDLLAGGKDMGDWDAFLDLINTPTVSSNNAIWDSVMAAIGNTTGLEYLRFPNRMLRATSRPKGMDPETWKRFPSMQRDKVFKMASGGDAPQGLYIVNEIGKELFVPNRLAHIIPPEVMAQIPKAKDGAFVIDQPPNSLFAPPEDGIIVPNRLMNQVPHAARGTRDEGFTFEPEGIRGPFGRYVRPEDIEGGRDADPAWMDRMYSVGAASGGPYDAPTFMRRPDLFRRTPPAGPAAGPTAAGPTPGAGAPPRTPEPPRGMHGAGSRDGVTRVFVTNWPAGGFGGGGATRVRQAGPGGTSDADFQAQHGPAPTEAGSAPPRRDRPGVLPERRLREYEAMRESASITAQSLAARTPRGMAAVAGSMIFGGRGENVAMIARQRHLIDQMQGHEAAARGRTEGGANVGQAETDRYFQIMNEEMPLARGREKEALQGQLAVLKDLNPALGELEDTETALAKTAPGAAAGVKNFVGILAGVQIYSMAMQGLGMVMTAVSPAIGDVVDQMLGWQATSSKLSSTMAKGIRESHGNVEAVVAQTAANAGLSKSAMEYVSDAVESIAIMRAGAQAQAETGGLFRGAFGAPNTTTGLYGGYGGVLDSGLFAQQMGGGTGYTEAIEGFFSKGAGGVDIPGQLNTGLKYITDEKYRNFVAGAAKDQGNPLGAITEIPGGLGDAISALNPFGKNFGSTFLFGMKDSQGVPYNAPPPADTGPFKAPVLETATEAEVKGYGAYMEDLNASIDRGAEATGKGAVAHWSYAESQDDINRATSAAIAAGDDYGLMLAQQGVVLRDNTRTVIDNGEAYRKANEQGARGKTIADVATWASGFARQIEGQRQGRQIATQRAINIDIPWETTKSLWAQPIIPAGAGFFPGALAGKPSPAAAGMSPRAGGMAKESLAITTAANEALSQIAKDGLDSMRQEIATNNPENLGAFDAGVTEAQNLSSSIATLTTNMAKLNLAASQANWGNQIRLAKRALGDALGMLGRAGGERLGYLQREQWMISRASQALNLALQQRQITTQVALAGFQAPGETGEERYMRQKEKLAEAAIEQKQLGYAKQEYSVAGEMWHESAKRAAVDAQKAIEVMTKARDAEAYAITAQESVSRQQARLGHTVAKLDQLVAQARGNFGDMLNAAANGVTEFSGSVETAVNEIYGSLGYSKDRKGNWYKPNDGGRNDGGGAMGAIGLTRGTTRAMIGEAGTEAVAILRNPRPFEVSPETGGGGGGSASVTVNINGTVVRDDKDIHQLARAVAAEVERTLSRKGQLLGLRSPAY
ncbi:MAG: hypothetical protein RJA59_1721 [Pseudomonadota bacterium]